MDAEVWAGLEAGGVVLAANARLARELGAGYDQRQQAAGLGTWPAAAIYALDSWLERAGAECSERLLLSGAQEQRLWEEILAASAAGEELLAVAAAAAAWKLARGWGAEWESGEWEESEDTAAFRVWARRVEARCARQGWTTAAELGTAVARGLRAGAVAAPARVWLAGFDELTPQQEELIEALRGAGAAVERIAPRLPLATPRVVRAQDREHELELAAQWARALLDQGVAGPIGVVVADLGGVRAGAERALLGALHPGRAPWSPAPRAFHLALGKALAETPVAGAALQALEAWTDAQRTELGPALAWMRSPFVSGAETEAGARAQLEHGLRRAQRARWTWAELRQQAAGRGATELAAAMRAGAAARASWPERQNHRGWAASWTELWRATGWPGERTLDSAEFQAAEAWAHLLEAFGQLDEVSPAAIGAEEARRRLGQRAAGRIFQARAGSAPVQVMGWGEAAGQEFSHLWVLGLEDGAVPAAAAPHPFLPLGWQRARGLPHASAEREAAFAARAWLRLRQSAGTVVASYPARRRDEELRPSPLLAGWEVEEGVAVEAAPAAVAMEAVVDWRAPGLAGAPAAGGSSIFTEQSACPFRAFAHLRLRAEAAERVPLGLSATVRGELLHDVLKVVWSRLQDQKTLLALPAAELRAMVERAAAEVVAGEARLRDLPGLAELERERLAETTRAWLEVEKNRTPFAVLQLEHETEAQLGGLELRLKLDRMDALEDGGLALLDYKSGKTGVGDWKAPRMKQPQLPLYLMTHAERQRVAALVFAQVRRGEMRLVGKERESKALLGTQALDLSRGEKLAWEEQLRVWQLELERVAQDYRLGIANVDPNPLVRDVCKHCDLPALCRIAESRELEEEEEEEAEGGDGE
ncbi:MAG TPA: PD-(D/E)XK nuclease family protein [Terriglobales bacterium]|nr:PD-(D/E)XK nuclease family protein [Terriglobales bacterium]